MTLRLDLEPLLNFNFLLVSSQTAVMVTNRASNENAMLFCLLNKSKELPNLIAEFLPRDLKIANEIATPTDTFLK